VVVVVGLSGGKHLYKSVAELIKARPMEIESRFFPDGELYLRFPEELEDDVVLIQSMYGDPNNKLVEYLFASKTALELGAKRVIGVIPYIAYARQDRRFKPGEAVSVRLVADMIKHSKTSRIITIDMHLHRVRGAELPTIFDMPVSNLTAMRLLARRALEFVEEPVFIGPDDEAIEFARVAASVTGAPYTNLKKVRLGDREVEISLGDKTIGIEGRDVVIVDDIISTGGTVVTAVKLLKKLGARKFVVAVTHALLVGDALERIRNAGVEKVFSANTVPSPISEVDVASIIAEELKKVL